MKSCPVSLQPDVQTDISRGLKLPILVIGREIPFPLHLSHMCSFSSGLHPSSEFVAIWESEDCALILLDLMYHIKVASQCHKSEGHCALHRSRKCLKANLSLTRHAFIKLKLLQTLWHLLTLVFQILMSVQLATRVETGHAPMLLGVLNATAMKALNQGP